MRKRILCTLILSLLVLTVCSSDATNTRPDEITPTTIVETQAEETVRGTVAPTEKSNEPDEVEIVERVEKTQAPVPTEKPTQKPTQKPTEKAKQESVNKNQTPVTMNKIFIIL